MQRGAAAGPTRGRAASSASGAPCSSSSPIGLGHAWRDVAIADALRRRVPGLRIEWLAQEPVTWVLRERGEAIHPASAELASEAEHIDREAGEHDLHAFLALRRMDEILAPTTWSSTTSSPRRPTTSGSATRRGSSTTSCTRTPSARRAPFAWLTDFVGYLPMPAGGEREAFLTADYNAEMIEHVERFPRVRDRAVYVGDPDDLVPRPSARGCPPIRAWTERHYAFAGYIPAYDPAAYRPTGRLRAELGYGDEPLCLVAVGRVRRRRAAAARAFEALPRARERVPACAWSP